MRASSLARRASSYRMPLGRLAPRMRRFWDERVCLEKGLKWKLKMVKTHKKGNKRKSHPMTKAYKNQLLPSDLFIIQMEVTIHP